MLNQVSKVASNNFNTTWKILLYKVIVAVVCAVLIVSIIVPMILPLLNRIGADTEFLKDINDVLTKILSGSFFEDSFVEQLEKLSASLILVRDILSDYAVTLIFSYIFTAIILILTRFLTSFGNYTAGFMINESMSCNAKLGFSATMIKSIKKASKFYLAHLLLTLPFDIIAFILVLTVMYFALPMFGLATMFFVVSSVIILVAFRMTLFSMWLPEYICQKSGVWKSLRTSAYLSFSRFFKLFSGYVIVVLFMLAANIFLIVYTFGVGLIILLPLGNMLLLCYYFVAYYRQERKSFYVSYDTIVDPPKDFDKEANNFKISEADVQKRTEELKKLRENVEEKLNKS
jgi:hypothetical protein